ncbi:MAG TPA: HD domain-containing phosphohydrolase [Planktothrix sp.]|jgi:HD-GYP domain-containing protein (c-di-GMP phosphodiesterase class II)
MTKSTGSRGSKSSQTTVDGKSKNGSTKGKTKSAIVEVKSKDGHFHIPIEGTPQEIQTAVREIESNLNKREVELIEREIKSLRLQEELDRLRPLSGLWRVVKAMATERRLDSLLDVITRETQMMLKCDRCSVFVLEAARGELWTQVAQGLIGHRTIRIPLHGTSIVSDCARTSQVINIPDAYSDARFDPDVDKHTGYHTQSVLCVPMLNRGGEVIGVFQVLNKVGGPFTSEDEDWLQGLTAVAAGLIEQAQAYDEIERFVDKTLETLAQTIDKRDPLTAGHSMRVTNYSLLVGQAMSVPDNDIDVLRYSAMMHDYGKIGVPEAILWKNGRLTPEEYATVQKHARITYDLLSNLPFTTRLAAVPFVASCHHEKVDGTGYYRGLRGNDIPFLSRIIAVSDVFDALTSVRHYRNRMPIDKVSEIMISGRDNHFEAGCVDAFYKLPAHRVLKVMESERDRQSSSNEIEMFKTISWQRLVELMCGSNEKREEEGLRDAFDRMYNANLPPDYQPLD